MTDSINFLSRFSRNSEAFASEFPENLEINDSSLLVVVSGSNDNYPYM